MTGADYLRHRDYAHTYLGMDDQEAHAYARRKTRTPDPEPPTPGQLQITDPDTPPGQIGPNDPWPEDFF